MKYKTSDPAQLTAMCLMFAKDILGWQPNGPHQIYWIDEALHNPYILLYSVPRGGKTMCIEVADIYQMATNEKEDLRIYAPKLDQCKETLKYHWDWIDGSKILKAYLRKRGGKPIFSTENYEFINRSNAECYTIAGKFEGHNVSIARVEEFDDWPWSKFVNDIVRRFAAASKNDAGLRVRTTGTIMGEENIFRLVTDPELSKMFKNLSFHPDWGLIDVYLLLTFGTVLDEKAVQLQKLMMTSDEWARSMLLRFTEAKNFIRERMLRARVKEANMWNLTAEKLEIGGRYTRRYGEIVGIGLDCGAAGSKADSSKYSLQINSQVWRKGMKYRRWLNGFYWEPSVDAEKLESDILDILGYYRPDGGYGDALKYDIIGSVNRKAFYKGYTGMNVDEFPENTPSNWEKWWIQPLYNHDKQKHEMYTTLQHGIDNGYHFFPYFDNKDSSHEAEILRELLRQMKGIRATKTGGSYPRYAAENKKVGDDHADAQAMATRWLELNGGGFVDPRLVKLKGKRDW